MYKINTKTFAFNPTKKSIKITSDMIAHAKFCLIPETIPIRLTLPIRSNKYKELTALFVIKLPE
ncbi:TPA: hypothetical protein ACGO1T_001887 [Streptococcus suis]